MADEERLLLALEDTASTGVRVASLRIANYVVGFVASILIARALGPQGRGLVALPIAFLGIVMAFAHLGLEHANVWLAAQGVPLRRLWGVGTLCAVGASLLVFILVGVARAIVGPTFLGGTPATWLVVTIGEVPLLLTSLYWMGTLQLDGRLRAAIAATVAGSAVHLGVVAVLAAADALTPFRVLLLAWVTNGTTWLLLLRIGSRVGIAGLRADRSLLRRAIAFGLKAQVATVFTFLLFRFDQILVQRELGFEALGLYSLAVVLAEVLWLATDPFAAALLPHQVRAGVGEDRQLAFATSRLSLLVAVVGGTLAWVLAPLVIRLAFGDAFVGAVTPFRWLLPGVAALALQRPLGQIVVKEGRVLLAAAMNAGALIVNVVLNLALLPRIGVKGASVASTVTYAALAVAYVLAVRRPGVGGFAELVPRRQDLGRLWHAVGRGRRPPRERRPGPPRAVLVIGTLELGGSERQVALLARGLLARGWEVTVLCLSAGGPLAAEIERAGGQVVVGGFRGLTPILDPRPLRRVLRQIRTTVGERDPDVVHAFLYWGTLIGVWAAHREGVPVVVASQRSLRSAMGTKRVLRPWERWAIAHADAWVCNSEAVREDALANGVGFDKLRVVRNGIDAGPAPEPVPTVEPARVLTVANLIGYKGHAVLIDALARVGERHRVELRLAGGGPEEEMLRARASSLGLSSRVVFLGSVRDVRAELDACRFTVLPSLSEGMPNAVLESMAAGRAVVATDVGGIPEALAGGGGILVPANDVDALAEGIGRLLDDPDLARDIGLQGRRALLERFGLDRMVQETLALYGELADGTPDGALRRSGRRRTGSSRS